MPFFDPRVNLPPVESAPPQRGGVAPHARQSLEKAPRQALTMPPKNFGSLMV